MNRRDAVRGLLALGAIAGPVRANAQATENGHQRSSMFRRRLPLPPPRNLPWPLKSVGSAKTSLSYDEFGRMVLHIRHDLLKGSSPEMVAWWFGNIGGDMELEGMRVNKYLVWHPQDHILCELAEPGPDGRASAGAKFRIVEAFGRNPDFYVDITDTVTRLDAAGITLVGYRSGQQVSRLNHDFVAVDGGTQYVSTLTIGTTVPGLRAVPNPLIHRTIFTEAMGHAWLRHNVEEVGLLEHIIPRVYPGNSRH
jgi:DAPG hydrolase PhiG domain